MRLLLDGQPVTGAMVGAIYATAKTGPDEWPLTAQTDASGEAEFTLDAPGPWLIRSVRMVRRDGASGPAASARQRSTRHCRNPQSGP